MVVERLLRTIALFTSSYFGSETNKTRPKNTGTQQKMKILNYSANHTKNNKALAPNKLQRRNQLLVLRVASLRASITTDSSMCAANEGAENDLNFQREIYREKLKSV
jgi:hypothetical protein